MRHKWERIQNLAVVMVLILECSSQAHNFEDDFSQTTNNETSLWSYRWKDSLTRDGRYQLLPSFRTDLWGSMPYFPIWTIGESQAYPWIGVNNSGVALFDPASDPDADWPWPSGQSNIHPLGSPGGLDALVVVSWLSPLSGSVDIQFRITDLDGRTNGGGDGVTYHVDKGSAAGNLASGFIPNGGDTGFLWILDVQVSAGDRLNFIIGPDANYFNDSTRMFIQIVPEPASLALLALGGVWIVLRRVTR